MTTDYIAQKEALEAELAGKVYNPQTGAWETPPAPPGPPGAPPPTPPPTAPPSGPEPVPAKTPFPRPVIDRTKLPEPITDWRQWREPGYAGPRHDANDPYWQRRIEEGTAYATGTKKKEVEAMRETARIEGAEIMPVPERIRQERLAAEAAEKAARIIPIPEKIRAERIAAGTHKVIGNQQMLLADWNAIDRKYQDIAIREKSFKAMIDAIAADTKKFERTHIIIGDKAMPIKSTRNKAGEIVELGWNDLDPKYQSIAIKENSLDAMEKAVGADIKTFEQETAKFETTNTRLPDNVYMANEDLEKLKKESPYLYGVATKEGYSQYEAELEAIRGITAPLNIEFYMVMARKDGTLPATAKVTATMPDGSAKFTTAPVEPKSKGAFAKELGLTAADFVVPGAWARHWDTMANWERGLNIGLDLLILVPVAGWAARFGGKALLKAGTSTIAKSLAREIPRGLVKVGERRLATEAKALAREIKVIDKAFANVEKAATKVVKAERGKSTEKFLKALKVEQVAKQELASTMNSWGNKAMKLTYDVSKIKLTPAVNETLSKIRTVSANSERFAEYASGVAKETARQRIPKSALQAATQPVRNAVKSYIETPRTIAEVTKAIAMGPKRGAAYLRGIQLGKLPKAKGAFTSEKELQAHLSSVKDALLKQRKVVEKRAAKYIGKDKTLDLWDKYIRESWPPSGGQWWPKGRTPPTPGGGVAVVEARAVTPQQAARLANTQLTGVGLRVAVPVGEAGKFGTVIANPREAPAVGRPLIEAPVLPDIVIVEPHLTTVTTEPAVEPTVKPKVWPLFPPIKVGPIHPPIEVGPIHPPIKREEPLHAPIPSPYHTGVYFIEPLREGVAKTAAEMAEEIGAGVKALSSTQVRTLSKAITSVKPTTTVAVLIGSKTAIIPSTKPRIVTKPSVVQKMKLTVAPAIKAAPVIKIVPAPTVAPTLAVKPAPAVKAAPVPAPVPAPAPKPKLLPPLFFMGGTDKKRRKKISDSDGAITWKQGRLHKKRVWQVGVYPFESESDWVTVLGRKPQNATVVDGPGSAYQTIKLLYGKAPPRRITGDMGIMDISIEPRGKRIIGIGFKPDLKQVTTGDFSIGKRTPSITERPPTLSKRGNMRITPKRPALRR